MFKITDEAITQFKKALSEAGLANHGVRIFASSCCGSIGLSATENGEENDILIEQNQLKLFVDPILYSQLSNSVLDFQDGFVIRSSD